MINIKNQQTKSIMQECCTTIIALGLYDKIIKPHIRKKQNSQQMKTYVLIVSQTFPANHTSCGKYTWFPKKIKSGDKIHTIRTNYRFWKKRVDEVNKGNAVLSVRFWTGKPYNSKQQEICKFYKLGIQKISILSNYIEIDKIPKNSPHIGSTLSANDGLSLQDFNDWFRKPVKNGCIIHFTDRRY